MVRSLTVTSVALVAIALLVPSLSRIDAICLASAISVAFGMVGLGLTYVTVGTKSLLFGVHQFAWHPVTVWVAWVRLYGEWPSWRECVCILVHDWGYWGCAEMDGVQGEQHPHLGARIAGRLFGPKYHDLVLWHSRYLSKKEGREPSKLCWADKASMIYEPSWFYLLRARASGEIREYRDNAAKRNFIDRAAPDAAWLKKLTEHLRVMAKEKAKEFVNRRALAA